MSGHPSFLQLDRFRGRHRRYGRGRARPALPVHGAPRPLRAAGRDTAHRHHRRLQRRRLDGHRRYLCFSAVRGGRAAATHQRRFVLIASSSGVEKARESERVYGSFFTHHLVAALRGAADRSGDGVVTLTDPFAYARERTGRLDGCVPASSFNAPRGQLSSAVRASRAGRGTCAARCRT
jgi:hypothetical protein